LLASKDEKAPVKLADFGLSTVVNNDDMLKTSCGTLTYAAPEVLRGKNYGKSVDMWSAGVITYILLSGYPPFWAADESESLQLTLNANYDCNLKYFMLIVPSPDWDTISDSAKDFIRNLIQVDPDERMTANEALNHSWITGEEPKQKGPNISHRVSKNLIKHFNARRKLKVSKA
jgi:calcium/calmodulin-dependent protein kinase I